MVACDGPTIQVEDLVLAGPVDQVTPTRTYSTLAEHERRYIQEVLDACDGVVSGPQGAAAVLGMKESTLRFRMKKLGIQRPKS